MKPARALLLLAGLGAVTGLAGLLLYGVLGPDPTPAGPVAVPPDDPATALQRHAGPVHILLAGTSLTANTDWPVALQETLSRCTARGVLVERLARPGEGIRWGLPALRARLADASLPRPDLVVAEFSGNDATLTRGLPLFETRRRTFELVETIRSAGAVPWLATMSPSWGKKVLIRPGQARYHALYRDVAAQSGAGLIDTIAQWRALDSATRRAMVPDGTHPTAAAMRQITVPAFAAALGPLVCDPPAG